MKRNYVWLVWFLFPFSLHAQVSIDEFILSVWDDPEIKSITAQRNFLFNKPYRLAPIRRMEFRTESNQLDPDRQEYSLRINPANPWEMKYTSQYFKTYNELLQMEQDRSMKELLAQRYELIIAWVYASEIKALREEDKNITQTLVKIMEGQRGSASFDAQDYLELRLDLIDKVLELENIQYELDHQRRIIEGVYEKARFKNLTWSNGSMISIDKIGHVIDSLWQAEAVGGEVAFRQKRVDLANRAWQLEKSNINLGFLQARYQEFRLEQDRNPWSVSLGITIPIFNPNKGDMTRRQLDAFEAQADLDKATLEQNSGRAIMRGKVIDLINRYKEMELLTDSLALDGMTATLATLKNNNPSVLIHAQRNRIKINLMKARLRREILTAYLEFLNYSEVLQQQPLVNYLSSRLSPLR